VLNGEGKKEYRKKTSHVGVEGCEANNVFTQKGSGMVNKLTTTLASATNRGGENPKKRNCKEERGVEEGFRKKNNFQIASLRESARPKGVSKSLRESQKTNQREGGRRGPTTS